MEVSRQGIVGVRDLGGRGFPLDAQHLEVTLHAHHANRATSSSRLRSPVGMLALPDPPAGRASDLVLIPRGGAWLGVIMPASDMATKSRRARSMGMGDEARAASNLTVPSSPSMKRRSLASAVMSCKRRRGSGLGSGISLRRVATRCECARHRSGAGCLQNQGRRGTFQSQGRVLTRYAFLEHEIALVHEKISSSFDSSCSMSARDRL